MPVQPYAPSAIRTDRIIVMADSDNAVQKVDESILTQDGTTVTAYWESQTLNRQDTKHEFTLTKVILYYSADSATTVTLTASPDGGNTWTAILGDTATTTIAATTGEIKNVVAGFNVTGYDLRLRIQFTTDVAVKIFGFSPMLVRRGTVDVAR